MCSFSSLWVLALVINTAYTTKSFNVEYSKLRGPKQGNLPMRIKIHTDFKVFNRLQYLEIYDIKIDK